MQEALAQRARELTAEIIALAAPESAYPGASSLLLRMTCLTTARYSLLFFLGLKLKFYICLNSRLSHFREHFLGLQVQSPKTSM